MKPIITCSYSIRHDDDNDHDDDDDDDNNDINDRYGFQGFTKKKLWYREQIYFNP